MKPVDTFYTGEQKVKSQEEKVKDKKKKQKTKSKRSQTQTQTHSLPINVEQVSFCSHQNIGKINMYPQHMPTMYTDVACVVGALWVQDVYIVGVMHPQHACTHNAHAPTMHPTMHVHNTCYGCTHAGVRRFPTGVILRELSNLLRVLNTGRCSVFTDAFDTGV